MIREASTTDLLRIAELEAVLFPDNSMSPAFLEREAKASRMFVLGSPVHAYAIVGTDGTFLDLLRLGVDPARQGEGAGTQLLAHIVQLGDVVLTVRKNNDRALRLYKRYGFQIVGHFTSSGAWALFRAAGRTSRPSTPSCGSHHTRCTG